MQDNRSDIEADIKSRYAALANNPSLEKAFPVGPNSAKKLGYSPVTIDSLPKVVVESFAGVGNPFELGELVSGQVVLDLGCGAGMDSILASRLVGSAGEVIGVDLVPEMVAKATANAKACGAQNVTFVGGNAEQIPLPDESVDVIITNGVFNLCVDKDRVVGEMFRVLKPGGRLQMADIFLEDQLTTEELKGLGGWSE
jgi:arsenite methyltransferase